MFTGIITDIGTIRSREDRGDTRLVIATRYDVDGIALGASIACSGVCLTVVERGGTAGDAWFDVDLSGETVSRTVPGMWNAGARQVNANQLAVMNNVLIPAGLVVNFVFWQQNVNWLTLAAGSVLILASLVWASRQEDV